MADGIPENHSLARLLDETGAILEEQDANPFRVKAYRDAAEEIRKLPSPLREIWQRGGREALIEIPHIGESLSRAIETWLQTGSLGILQRLRGEEAAIQLFRTVPGIGRDLAQRIHHDLHVSSLEDLEAAAHDGRLAEVEGIGPRRLQSIRDQLDARLRRRVRVRAVGRPESGLWPESEGEPARDAQAGHDGKAPVLPAVVEILDVDREYRELALADRLPRIRPRRFNPKREAWLPVLHCQRGERHYTALFSNTARAHELGRTHDWVVVYLDDGVREQQWTVVTEQRGPLAGRRVVRGLEVECLEHYAIASSPA